MCNFCDHISNKISNIKQHLKGVHKNIELKPGNNGFTTTVKESNVDKDSPEKTFSCEQCSHQSTSASGLQKHMVVVHDGGQTIKCGECDYETKSKKDYAIHIKDIHTPRVFMCDQCDYTASNSIKIKVHKKRKHEGVKYSCDQ